MYHHLDNGEVEFTTPEIVADQHTTINNKSQVTVTPILLGKNYASTVWGCPITIKTPAKF